MQSLIIFSLFQFNESIQKVKSRMKNKIYWGILGVFGLILTSPLKAQASLEDSFMSFTDWCVYKDNLPKSTKLVIEQILSRFPDEKYTSMDRNPLERINKNAFESSLYPSTNDCKRVGLLIKKVESYTHYGTGVRVDIRPFAYFTNIKQLRIEFGFSSRLTPFFDFEKGLVISPKIDNYIPSKVEYHPFEVMPAVDPKPLLLVKYYPLEVMPVVDLKPLSLLTKMEYLHIEGNIPVNDLTPIKSMKKLKYLFINRWIGTDKPDLRPLRGLSSLLTIFINNNYYPSITLDGAD